MKSTVSSVLKSLQSQEYGYKDDTVERCMEGNTVIYVKESRDFPITKLSLPVPYLDSV